MSKKITILILIVFLFLLLFLCCTCGYIFFRTDQFTELKDRFTDSHDKNSDDSTENDTLDNDETEVQKYAIVVSGISNGGQHYGWFKNSSDQAYKLLKQNGYLEENIYYLFENENEPNVDYESTLENFKKVITELKEKSTQSDSVVVILIGHGSYSGSHSSYALKDGNLQDDTMASLFQNIKRDKLIFVFSPCNSGGFVNDLSGKDTIIITSTRQNETNSAAFIEPFLTSFGGEGDINADGKVSFAEAFNYASNNVRDQYINNNWGNLKEHAQLDDNSDGISHEAPVPNGGDGKLASESYL